MKSFKKYYDLQEFWDGLNGKGEENAMSGGILGGMAHGPTFATDPADIVNYNFGFKHPKQKEKQTKSFKKGEKLSKVFKKIKNELIEANGKDIHINVLNYSPDKHKDNVSISIEGIILSDSEFQAKELVIDLAKKEFYKNNISIENIQEFQKNENNKNYVAFSLKFNLLI